MPIKYCNFTGYIIGILAGAWPCGTVTMITELFCAESKTQVYGTLHTFLSENKEETKNISMLYIWECPLIIFHSELSLS